MKKTIFTFITAFSFAVGAFGAENPVPASVVKTLNTEFKNAENVQWQTTEKFYKAQFLLNSDVLTAFYNFDGSFAGVSRHIKPEQLPLALMQQAKEKGNAENISELFELLTDRGTEYFITYGSGNEKKTFRSSGDSWSRY